MICIPKPDRRVRETDEWVPSQQYVHAKAVEIQRHWTPEKRERRAAMAKLYLNIIATSCPTRS